jgi:peptide deformylase
MSYNSPKELLPDYVVINDLKSINKEVLRNPAESMAFPLSIADRKIIDTLVAKYDQEENIAGLAAPQLGFNKQVIVFTVDGTTEMKSWRPDLTDTMPKSVWINPSYEPVGTEIHTDYEACFSVKDIVGEIPRFVSIRYTAYAPDGTLIQGEANGFLARVIQHEVDHLHGKLFIDYIEPDKLISMEEYKKIRANRIEQGRVQIQE